VKNSIALLPFQLLLRRNCRFIENRIESYFCRSSVAGQPISVLVIVQMPSTQQRQRKDVSTSSVLTRNSNGTTECQRHNGTEQRNGTGRTAMEWWKLGISLLPDGSPHLLCGAKFCQKIEWLMWPPALKRSIDAAATAATPSPLYHTITSHHITQCALLVGCHLLLSQIK